MAGRFIPTEELYFGARIGEVNADGVVYEMHVRSNDNTPIIVNTQNGKKFHLDWEEILMQAMEAGIGEK